MSQSELWGRAWKEMSSFTMPSASLCDLGWVWDTGWGVRKQRRHCSNKGFPAVQELPAVLKGCFPSVHRSPSISPWSSLVLHTLRIMGLTAPRFPRDPLPQASQPFCSQHFFLFRKILRPREVLVMWVMSADSFLIKN